MDNEWEINFISKLHFKEHVLQTIEKYSDNLKSIDLSKFNSNIIDPVKLTFDSKVYRKSLEQIIVEEIARQRDKSNNNAIGYFHQNLFSYLNNCIVPNQGFDVIAELPTKKINVEMKNKHNTMNSASAGKTYIKMQNHILHNSSDFCYLVEVIAKKSQNIEWKITVDGEKYSSPKIRRVSIDQFYSEVTGDPLAFKKICNCLPDIIEEILTERVEFTPEEDTVFREIWEINPDIHKSLYLLAFKTYLGF